MVDCVVYATSAKTKTAGADNGDNGNTEKKSVCVEKSVNHGHARLWIGIGFRSSYPGHRAHVSIQSNLHISQYSTWFTKTIIYTSN